MQHERNNTYANYFDHALSIDPITRRLKFYYEGRGVIGDDIYVRFLDKDGKMLGDLCSFGAIKYVWDQPLHETYAMVRLDLREGPAPFGELTQVTFRAKRDRVEADADGLPEGVRIEFSGNLYWGELDDSFAMCLDRDGSEDDLRAAYGHAVSTIDDCLFDRKTDMALRLSGRDRSVLDFSHERGCYTFLTEGTLSLESILYVYRTRFRTNYSCINKNTAFKTAHTGWMTWYSVKFEANEEVVLKNARFQRQFLYDYGAKSIWIDWDWYHEEFGLEDAPKDIGFFQPNKQKYPHGLGYIAQQIKELGFIPVLWVAPTVEPAETEIVKEFRDSLLTDCTTWCGKYFFDISDERVVNELIPRAFEQVKEWGFEAVKWDCLPNTVGYADEWHECMKHPEITSTESLRRLCQKAREVVGEDFYMMSCAGGNDREVLMLSDVFDTARIGNDIFHWRDFIGDFVERILRFYSFHNVSFYCDPDNVVIRPEYSDFEQARSRVSAVSLLGLPVTFGDELTELPADRIEMLRRALPTLDIHPMDVRELTHDGKRFFVTLAVDTPYERWNVFDILNMQEHADSFTINLPRQLHIEQGEYLVFDFWHQKLLGIYDGDLTLELEANQSAVCAVRRLTGRPQIASTSRHLTQGAAELSDVRWDENSLTLSGSSEVVCGDGYKIFVYVPQGFVPTEGEVCDGILTLTPDDSENRKVDWSVSFRRA